MKIYALFLMILSFTTVQFGQTPSDRERANLKGLVKSVEAYTVEYKVQDDEPILVNRKHWYDNVYNQKGYLTGSVTYESGVASSRNLYTFDEQGRSTGYEVYLLNKERAGEIPTKYGYTFDEDGRKINDRNHQTNSSPGNGYIYKYDVAGHQIESYFQDSKGAISNKKISTYDSKGKQITQTYYDSATGKAINNTLWIYSANQDKTEKLEYINGLLRYKTTIIKDNKGRMLEREYAEFNVIKNLFNRRPKPHKEVYSYDDRKMMVEAAHYTPEGVRTAWGTCMLNKDGNNLNCEAFYIINTGNNSQVIIPQKDNQSVVVTLPPQTTKKTINKYEYDAYGNWTKQTTLTYLNDYSKLIRQDQLERAITYHH